MLSAATNTNNVGIASGGPVLASGEHMTGGLVAARHCLRPVGRPWEGRGKDLPRNGLGWGEAVGQRSS